MPYKPRAVQSKELENLLSEFGPEVQDLGLRLRDLVLKMEPDAIEQIDIPAHLLAYGYAKTYKHLICVIIFYKEYVNFGFPRGVDLPDPNGLLEGTGKRARHVKVKTVEQANNPALRNMLQVAIATTPTAEE